LSSHIHNSLDAYLERMLDPVSEDQFDRHVAGCRSCRKALIAAREARQYIDWLLPTDPAPVPGPDFFYRVEQSIEKRVSRNWFENLAGAIRPRLAYPLLFLGLLAAAWTLTYNAPEPEEGLAAIEYPAAEFAQMAYTTSDRELSEDLVMMNLVELPVEQ
jgi:Putative zinc-finger